MSTKGYIYAKPKRPMRRNQKKNNRQREEQHDKRKLIKKKLRVTQNEARKMHE